MHILVEGSKADCLTWDLGLWVKCPPWESFQGILARIYASKRIGLLICMYLDMLLSWSLLEKSFVAYFKALRIPPVSDRRCLFKEPFHENPFLHKYKVSHLYASGDTFLGHFSVKIFCFRFYKYAASVWIRNATIFHLYVSENNTLSHLSRKIFSCILHKHEDFHT